jgi:acyl carrier protein
MDDINTVVRNYIIREYLPEGDDRQITETTPLISSGIVDSFSMVSLLRFLEKKYAIHIPDDAATPEAFDTVERIVVLVRRFQKTAAAASS